MAQTKQGIHNSMLLECVKWDSEHATLRNVEGPDCLMADQQHRKGLEEGE